MEELSDDDNNEDECDMDGEETEVENAMHQMSFDDCAEHAFSGRMQATTSAIMDLAFMHARCI